MQRDALLITRLNYVIQYSVRIGLSFIIKLRIEALLGVTQTFGQMILSCPPLALPHPRGNPSVVTNVQPRYSEGMESTSRPSRLNLKADPSGRGQDARTWQEHGPVRFDSSSGEPDADQRAASSSLSALVIPCPALADRKPVQFLAEQYRSAEVKLKAG